jgi:hypothetical protein
MSFPFPQNPVDGQVVNHVASDGAVLKATYHADKNNWTVSRELPPTQVVTSPERFEVHATHDQQVITWDAATGKWIAQNNPVKLTELRDVDQHAAPSLGTVPVWTYQAGHPEDGRFNFATQPAHIKNWESVVHWESGAAVYHRGHLWRATQDNTNHEPQIEPGRATLYLYQAGEPSFGLVPIGISSGVPASGEQPWPSMKYAYWLQILSDTDAHIWKLILQRVDPVTKVKYGTWVKQTWPVVAWRYHLAPPAKMPPGISIVWINDDENGNATPVIGQQQWARLDLTTSLASAEDSRIGFLKHHDVLVYDATTKKWVNMSKADFLATTP